MNAGSRNEGSLGYEMNYLTKVRGFVDGFVLGRPWLQMEKFIRRS